MLGRTPSALKLPTQPDDYATLSLPCDLKLTSTFVCLLTPLNSSQNSPLLFPIAKLEKPNPLPGPEG